jgi:protein-tyrosine phosphatase
LLPLAEGSSYFAFVHGDLNGANIIVDAQENVWLIDFFHTHRGHVLQDLLKFENDLLYIMTPLASDQELRAALEATNQLMQIEDLAKPLADPQHAGGWPEALRHAWKTLQTLRSFYPALIQSDRSPLQAWIGQMRYAMHTLSFDEASPRQKAWALYTAGHCAARITEQSRKNGPLRVDWIQDSLVAPGRLGLTILPGRRDLKRHLPTDLEALKGAGVTHVLCLLPDMELRHYGVGTLMQAYAQAGFKARQAPMVDQKTTSVEDMREVTAWTGAALAEGGRVTVHCTGGLGRSGMVAACCLKIKGLSSDQAIAEVRRVRSQRAIETAAQEEFIRAFMPS